MFFGVGTLHPKQSVTAIGSGRSASGVVGEATLHSIFSRCCQVRYMMGDL